MARRSRRKVSPPDDGPVRTPRLGAHWRADGTPKNSYMSQAEALAVADERRLDAGADLSAYRCEVCAAWHLANSAGRHER